MRICHFSTYDQTSWIQGYLPSRRWRCCWLDCVPDFGITTLNDVLTNIPRITDVCDLPLLVDADTGFGNTLDISRTVKSLMKFGAATMHLEDQVTAKRCNHRPGKMLINQHEMIARITAAAVDARSNPDFVIMARTDAFASEG